MRHLVLLFVVLAAGYGLWQFTCPLMRAEQLGLLARHGLRLAVLAVVLLALLVLAFFLPSAKLL
ncbi:hypothetical protein [Hydrogenophaga pseudoflava]|uniref:hypothetical protein n=1 Tax=Hydrogenophaga pseudoflava TaxID=47421 RepID=UPI0027E477AF|nr:hypothetical protein [Hydrogenophaga pseudoflava]MDQ7743349.1 hypothetical protein [Hydrogenophaga pseudoflava]